MFKADCLYLKPTKDGEAEVCTEPSVKAGNNGLPFLIIPERNCEECGLRKSLIKESIDNPITASESELSEVKIKVYALLLRQDRNTATEEIVKYIRDNNYIYTTRNDDNPEVWIYKEGIYKPEGQTYIKETCRQILEDAYTTHIVNIILGRIQADSYIEPKEFFSNNIIDEVPVQNGILNIFTKTITPFTPDKIFFNKLPVTYDQTAKCPNVLQHLKTILPNEDEIPLMQEIFGYLLYKEYRIEKAIMFNGGGRNGKGKTLSLMKALLGSENITSIPLQTIENDNFAMAQLFGKMANISADLSKEALDNTGKFKELTGRDYVTAQRKFLNPIYFTNYAKMIFACNELPRTKDLTIAFWSRWVYIDFPYTFYADDDYEKLAESEKANAKIKDDDILSKLTTPEEISGLLNWALEGLSRLLNQGDFSNTKNAKEIERLWTMKTDSFMIFVKDNLISDYGSCVPKVDLRDRYDDYCTKNKLVKQGERHIKNVLEERYNVRESQDYANLGGLRVWNNIKWKS